MTRIWTLLGSVDMLHTFVAPILFGAVLIFLAFAATGIAPLLSFGRVPSVPVPRMFRVILFLVGAVLVLGAFLGVFKNKQAL
jgi:hypothetical protein